MKSPIQLVAVLALCNLLAFPNPACAQSTAFVYQGRLSDGGSAANGTYDLSFALFNSASGASQLGSTVTQTVFVSNGTFTATLDYGANFPGADRWLEIGVWTNSGPYVTLSPRQKLTAAPYAITAGGLATGTYGNAVTFNNGADNFNGTFIGQFLGYSFIGGGFTGSFVGNGSGLIGLNASALSSGVVPPAQEGALTNHLDVAVLGLVPGQVLVYNGTSWVNAPLPSGGQGQGTSVPVSLTYSGTNVPVNAAVGTHFRLTATNNFLLQNPTGAADGQRMVFEIIQDPTGGRTMTFGNAFKFSTDLPVANLSTNAGLRDFITCICSGTNFYVVGFIKGF